MFVRSSGGDPRRLPTYRLDAAMIAIAIGVVLAIISFIIYAYYYERIMDPDLDRDFEEIMDLMDLVKYSMYAKCAGWVAALVGAVLVIQAVMVAGLGSASSAARQIPLRGILWVCVVMTLLMALLTALIIWVYEAEPDLGESAMRMVSRMVLYLPNIATVLGTAALLVVTMFLRNASLDRGRPQPPVP